MIVFFEKYADVQKYFPHAVMQPRGLDAATKRDAMEWCKDHLGVDAEVLGQQAREDANLRPEQKAFDASGEWTWHHRNIDDEYIVRRFLFKDALVAIEFKLRFG